MDDAEGVGELFGLVSTEGVALGVGAVEGAVDSVGSLGVAAGAADADSATEGDGVDVDASAVETDVGDVVGEGEGVDASVVAHALPGTKSPQSTAMLSIDAPNLRIHD